LFKNITMSYLVDFKIENFRGFDELQIEGLSKINLFLGKNNSGKTSLLEAFFLLVGMSNPVLPDTINRIRGINLTSPQHLKYLFHDFKFENNPNFYGSFDDTSERWLRLSPRYQKRLDQDSSTNKETSDDLTLVSATTQSRDINGLDLNFSFKRRHEQKKTLTSSLVLNLSEIGSRINKEYVENLHGVFLHANTKDNNTLARYSQIVKNKQSDLILKTLQAFDNRIESIQALPDGIFFGIKGINELVPSNIIGDGMRKFLNIITAIAEAKNSIILIDEIENGLHFSAHKLLWESIINMTKTFNTQLFITTHNLETLTCLKQALEEERYNDMTDSVKIFTLSQTSKAGIKTYRYSYEAFKEAIDNETELRS
jgi:AAA15 family ATPase/GTPase